MIGRILLSLAAFALAGFVLLVLIGLWDGYEQETKALGFSGLYERYLASQAGFADDPKAYRQQSKLSARGQRVWEKWQRSRNDVQHRQRLIAWGQWPWDVARCVPW